VRALLSRLPFVAAALLRRRRSRPIRLALQPLLSRASPALLLLWPLLPSADVAHLYHAFSTAAAVVAASLLCRCCSCCCRESFLPHDICILLVMGRRSLLCILLLLLPSSLRPSCVRRRPQLLSLLLLPLLAHPRAARTLRRRLLHLLLLLLPSLLHTGSARVRCAGGCCIYCRSCCRRLFILDQLEFAPCYLVVLSSSSLPPLTPGRLRLVLLLPELLVDHPSSRREVARWSFYGDPTAHSVRPRAYRCWCPSCHAASTAAACTAAAASFPRCPLLTEACPSSPARRHISAFAPARSVLSFHCPPPCCC